MKPSRPSSKTTARIKKMTSQSLMALALIGVGMLINANIAPAAGRGGAGARAGQRGGPAIPNASPAQNAALTLMNSDLTPLQQALTTARAELFTAEFTAPRSADALRVKVEAVKAAELALANARTAELAIIQTSPNKLAANQVAALSASAPAGRGPGVTNVPGMNSAQVAAMTQLTGVAQKLLPSVTAARAAVTAAALADPRDDAAIKKAIDALAAAELALANARADILSKLQASPDKLTPPQIAAAIASNGIIVSGTFSPTTPLNFNDHEGYVSLFDGATLQGWDGNPKFWRVADGVMVGESTAQNPSGNTYIAYRGTQAKDFTLKLEIKIEGAGGSGIQYRSQTGIPWLTAVQPAVIANAGPTNLDWMMTGPQADFWPSRDTTAQYSGQFYSENTPMRIMAYRGEVVEGFGMGPRRLLGTIADRMELGKLIKQNDWNQYTVIARGGTFIHIINGQLMSVMIDDDPASSNNVSGFIGIEIEATTKVSVRNVWLKKIN